MYTTTNVLYLQTDEEMIRYIEDEILPEPKPSKLKKKDVIVDVQEFSKVDEHARKVIIVV